MLKIVKKATKKRKQNSKNNIQSLSVGSLLFIFIMMNMVL